MRIAQVSPLIESVPPQQYGGTERIVSYLTEELVRAGHDVTLFASGDSRTSARLEPLCPAALRLHERRDELASHLLLMERVIAQAQDFDIIHFHTGYLHFPACRRLSVPHVTTHHGRLDFNEWLPLFHEFQDIPVISISDQQRAPIPWVNWLDTVYNGIPADLYRFNETPGDYVAFLGRISPEKRVDRAIDIALRAGMHIKVAAKIDKVDRDYYDAHIKHLFDHPGVEYVGEIGDREKAEFLGNARALLFPIDWPEPFGLVMIEAMACGTPVIAYRRGSVPEVVDDGVTGRIVNDRDEAVAALEAVDGFDRRACREVFEQRFTAARMAEDYLAVYEMLQACGHPRPRLAS